MKKECVEGRVQTDGEKVAAALPFSPVEQLGPGTIQMRSADARSVYRWTVRFLFDSVSNRAEAVAVALGGLGDDRLPAGLASPYTPSTFVSRSWLSV